MPLPHTPVSWKAHRSGSQRCRQDARIATEKALESQEKDIVTEFSSMTIFDKIALGVHLNPSSSPPTLRFIPKGEFRAERVKKAFENFSN